MQVKMQVWTTAEVAEEAWVKMKMKMQAEVEVTVCVASRFRLGGLEDGDGGRFWRLCW